MLCALMLSHGFNPANVLPVQRSKLNRGPNIDQSFLLPPSLSLTPIPAWFRQLASGSSGCYVNSLDYLLREKR